MQVTVNMIQEAAEVLKQHVRHTELHPLSASLLASGQVYLKAENLQRTGSFKVRGAINRMAALTLEERNAGVICASAGNHAQGVALAASMLGVKATVVMPVGAPLSKLAATQSYGAQVVLHGASFDEALAHAFELQAANGFIFIHAFDDPLVIAGQGTIGLEIMQALPHCEAILVPVGGGGLAAGIAVAAKGMNPRVKVIGVEPQNAASMYASVLGGRMTRLAPVPTIADGAAVLRPGDLTYELCRTQLDDIITVTEEEIATAILSMLERMKIVCEGAGAVAVAAALNGYATRFAGPVVAVVSGGNIDVNTLEWIIDKGLLTTGRRMVLSTVIKDRPGNLSQLLDIIGGMGANVLSVTHNRLSRDTPVGLVSVSLDLETRNELHIQTIRDTLQNQGYPLS